MPDANFWSRPEVVQAHQFISNNVKQRIRAHLSEHGKNFLEANDEPYLEEWIGEAVSLHAADVGRQGAGGAWGTSPLAMDDYEQIGGRVYTDEHPLGPVAPFMRDPTITEVRILGTDCYFMQDGIKHYTRLAFEDEEGVKSKLVTFFASRQKRRRIDESNPLATLILPNGDRCHIALDSVAVPLAITIRRHQPERFSSFEALLKQKAFPEWLLPFLKAVVKARLNFLVAGGLGTGKTTWVRVFGATFPEDERIGTIEDDPELYLRDLRKFRYRTRDTRLVECPPDCFSLIGKGENVEGKGEITLTRLVKESLRMSADRIIVGEVRGKEALDMIKAMSSGFPGSGCTIHADSAEDTLYQLQGYAMEHPDSPKDPDMMMRRVCRTINIVFYLRRVRQEGGHFKPLLDQVAIVNGFDEQNRAPKVQTIVKYDDLKRDWDWTGNHPRQLGTLPIQSKFLAAEVDMENLIPADVLRRADNQKLNLS